MRRVSPRLDGVDQLSAAVVAEPFDRSDREGRVARVQQGPDVRHGRHDQHQAAGQCDPPLTYPAPPHHPHPSGTTRPGSRLRTRTTRPITAGTQTIVLRAPTAAATRRPTLSVG